MLQLAVCYVKGLFRRYHGNNKGMTCRVVFPLRMRKSTFKVERVKGLFAVSLNVTSYILQNRTLEILLQTLRSIIFIIAHCLVVLIQFDALNKLHSLTLNSYTH